MKIFANDRNEKPHKTKYHKKDISSQQVINKIWNFSDHNISYLSFKLIAIDRLIISYQSICNQAVRAIARASAASSGRGILSKASSLATAAWTSGLLALP